MRTKRKVNRIILLMFCYFVGLTTFATGASTGLAQVLGPCIDDQTFAVARLDITKLDLDAFFDKFLSLVSTDPNIAKHVQDDRRDFQSQVGAQLNDLQKAGGKDIFVVFSVYDFPYFFVAIPIHSAGNRTELHQQVQKIVKEYFNIKDIEIHASDRLILVGLKQTITRIKTATRIRSRALEAGFQACANKTAQVVLFPSSDQRRILAEMLPQIPPSESGNIKFTTLGKDLQWAALGLDGPPSISLNLTIQSANAEGADRMLTFVNNLYSLAGHYNEARPLIPELDQLLKSLTPRKHGKRLLLQIDSTTADSIISDILAPSLLNARAQARRYACATNLSGIGKALLIYANDYNDQLPPDLETLISKAEMPAKGLVCPGAGLKDKDPYIYRGASITTSDAPWMIMAYDKTGNHGDGRNVLFLDTHVEWVSEERFQKLIKKDNDYRREKGFPVLPAQ